MIFAITDIETTGSYASGHTITEIAICLHNGEKVIDEWHSLVNPDKPIPYHITRLTGITNEMVEDAPSFSELAKEIDEFTKDAVFVAHNVHFDYSFIKKAFELEGIRWNRSKLCTVRLSRKIFPGYRSYSLSNLCRQREINNEAPHRALGDTRATSELFTQLLQNDEHGEIEKALKRGSGDHFLPQNLDKSIYHALPESPGVYYFHDSSGKVIYVGKAKNIKKRVRSHFSGGMKSARRQTFAREIRDITYQLTGTELIAFLIEDNEIRRLWPKFNYAQKSQAGKYGVFKYLDQKGFYRLAVQKVSRSHQPVRRFHSAFEARNWLFRFADRHDIPYEFCGLPVSATSDSTPEVHNKKLHEALEGENNSRSSFALRSKGRSSDEHSFILIERGHFKGIGFIENDVPIRSVEEAETFLIHMTSSQTIESHIFHHIEKRGLKGVVPLKDESMAQ
ncbi:exonuclease domain-containing protein [Halocola ammonii]